MENNLNNGHPTLIMVCGPIGAGKSTLMELLKKENLRDSISFKPIHEFNSQYDKLVAEMRPGYAMYYATVRAEKALQSHIQQALDKRADFLLESGLEKNAFSAYVPPFSKNGYKVELDFICTDHIADCTLREQQRSIISKDLPVVNIKAYYLDNLQELNKLCTSVNRVNIYDGTRLKPTLLATMQMGQITMANTEVLKKEWIKHLPNLASAIKKHLAPVQKKNKGKKM